MKVCTGCVIDTQLLDRLVPIFGKVDSSLLIACPFWNGFFVAPANFNQDGSRLVNACSTTFTYLSGFFSTRLQVCPSWFNQFSLLDVSNPRWIKVSSSCVIDTQLLDRLIPIFVKAESSLLIACPFWNGFFAAAANFNQDGSRLVNAYSTKCSCSIGSFKAGFMLVQSIVTA